MNEDDDDGRRRRDRDVDGDVGGRGEELKEGWSMDNSTNDDRGSSEAGQEDGKSLW